MTLLTFHFLVIFFPCFLCIYWGLKSRTELQNLLLFMGSLLFLHFAGGSILIVLLCTLITFLCGQAGRNGRKKRIPALGLAADAVFLILSRFVIIPTDRFPISLSYLGTSFYILQSATYLTALLKNEEKPETDIIGFAAFVSYFPTVLSGPILRSREMLPQIHRERNLSAKGAETALWRFLWGAFLKCIIADRIAQVTGPVFEAPNRWGGEVLFLGMCLYAVQLYADFAGYSQMAIAVSAFLGFDIPENFLRPYFAQSVSEFWRRWHRSLTDFLTENVYYPLGGNRKGTVRRDLNILMVFLVSAFWHGKGKTFLCWGMLHAFFQVFGRRTLARRRSFKEKIGIHTDGTIDRIWKRGIVFLLCAGSWVIFRLPSLGQSRVFFLQMLRVHRPWELLDGSLLSFMSMMDWIILVGALLILIGVERMQERNIGISAVTRQMPILRALAVGVSVLALLTFGVYGPSFASSAFIYAGF